MQPKVEKDKTMPMSAIVSEEYRPYGARFFYISLAGKRNMTTQYLARIPVSLN